MKIKYILIGGTVRSATDGGWHHITARQLVGLYGLKPEECALYDHWPNRLARPAEYYTFRSLAEHCIILEPRYRGDYREHLAQLSPELQLTSSKETS